MRIHQYVKNLFIFLPLFFAMKITDTGLLSSAFIAFIAFSLTASAIYTLNDYHDIEEDRQHPKRKTVHLHQEPSVNLRRSLLCLYSLCQGLL